MLIRVLQIDRYRARPGGSTVFVARPKGAKQMHTGQTTFVEIRPDPLDREGRLTQR